MHSVLQSITAGLPVFMLHFLTAIAVFVVSTYIYMRITPYREMQMIREGNIAAAISLSSALIGLALPLSFCLEGSVNTYDIVLWGGVILAIQLITYAVIDRLLHHIGRAIKEERIAPVLFLAAVKLSVAMLNAAAIAS